MGALEKATAKWLAIGLLIAEPLHIAFGDWFTTLLPQSLQQAKLAPVIQHPSLLFPIAIVGLILLVCLFVGLVGLILYKWWGRLLYTLFWGGNLLLLPLFPPIIRPSLEASVTEFKLLASGALLALVWMSSVRHLYVRKPRNAA